MKKTNLFFVISLLFSFGLRADDTEKLKQMAEQMARIEDTVNENNQLAKEQAQFLRNLKGAVQIVAGKILLPKFEAGLSTLEGQEKEEAQQVVNALALLLGVQSKEADSSADENDQTGSEQEKDKKTAKDDFSSTTSANDKTQVTLNGTN